MLCPAQLNILLFIVAGLYCVFSSVQMSPEGLLSKMKDVNEGFKGDSDSKAPFFNWFYVSEKNSLMHLKRYSHPTRLRYMLLRRFYSI